jgi:tRNA-Thr(GGU) m(6)t(6)A37 methyltransferase TsaA
LINDGVSGFKQISRKSMMVNLTLKPIGIVHSCFGHKFGIPRQPGIVPDAKAIIELLPPYNVVDAVQGLNMVSHIWVQFLFHGNRFDHWKAKVKPPRLGGNKTMGVFATRSPNRPNPLGLSAVKLEGIEVRSEATGAGVLLSVSGHDFLDGTPVVDIKPYVPYADCIPDARNDFALLAPPSVAVRFSESWRAACAASLADDLKALIAQVLAQNPRPAYQKHDPDRIYGMELSDCNIQWRYERNLCDNSEAIVVESVRLNKEPG